MRDKHQGFYDFVGANLTAQRETSKITITQLANKVGEQYNTLKGIENGRRFHAHQILWIEEFLDESISQIFQEYISQGVQSDEEIKEESYVQETVKEGYGLSTFF